MKKNEMITINKKESIENKKFQFILKRLMDIILSCVGIIILSPIYLIIIIAIKLDSKGATVFRQVRVGIITKFIILIDLTKDFLYSS